MDETTKLDDFHILQTIISALSGLNDEDRIRIIQTVLTFYKLSLGSSATKPRGSIPTVNQDLSYSAESSVSAKEFLVEKQPRTDVERMACLAYYLTHYRSHPHFKTLDLNKLNTEAAQPKFSNAPYAAQNAVKMGYLALAEKGNRQLSAAGEQFVRALPDRDAAKQAMATWHRKKRGTGRRAKSARNNSEPANEQEEI